jgi:hypothetical protein
VAAARRRGTALRAAEVDAIVGGMPGSDSLAALIDIAPEPWAGVFEQHREALRLLLTEIDAAAAENRRILKAELRRFRLPARLSARTVRDEDAVTALAAYRASLATTDSIPQLSLQEFLA